MIHCITICACIINRRLLALAKNRNFDLNPNCDSEPMVPTKLTQKKFLIYAKNGTQRQMDCKKQRQQSLDVNNNGDYYFKSTPRLLKSKCNFMNINMPLVIYLFGWHRKRNKIRRQQNASFSVVNNDLLKTLRFKQINSKISKRQTSMLTITFFISFSIENNTKEEKCYLIAV